MRKFLSALILILVFSFSASAKDTRIGVIALLDEAKFNDSAKSFFLEGGSLFSNAHEDYNVSYVFYDNLQSMLMALNSGVIDELGTFAVTARYILSTNENYKLSCIDYNDAPSYFSFGFLRGKGENLRDKINNALMNMRADGTLNKLILDYTLEAGITPQAVKFEKFDGADEIKVAVTGDIPPLDFVNAAGEPAGFNTAILAEIGKRLKLNIKVLNIDTVAKTAALTSGRADIVFWYLNEYGDNPLNSDVAEDVILSAPYYEFNTYMHISKK